MAKLCFKKNARAVATVQIEVEGDLVTCQNGPSAIKLGMVGRSWQRKTSVPVAPSAGI